MTRENLIEIDDLAKSYWIAGRNLRILHELSMAVECGEFVAIMGTSGSGKSTLLNIMGCLDRPTAGRYCFAGHETADASDAQLSRLRAGEIGFVFQNFNLLPHLSVFENVELPFFYAAQSPQQPAEAVEQALLQVGLGDRLTHKPAELSGGEMQRVAIARAIVTRPSLILADEPTGSLDSVTGAGILDLLDQLNDAGTTIVLVTHDNEVASRAERKLVLKDGCFVN